MDSLIVGSKVDEETLTKNSPHRTSAKSVNEVVAASVDHTGGGDANVPAGTTNDPVLKSGRENMYPTNFYGSDTDGYHIMVRDSVKTI